MRFFIAHMIFMFLAFSTVLHAQDESKAYDTAYIQDLSDSLALRVYGINKFNGFTLRDNVISKEVQYSPNRNLNLGLGVNYKWFGLGVAVNLPFLNDDNEKYGNTRRFDAQTHIYTRKYLIDFYGHIYSGFYIANPQVYLPKWDAAMNFPQRQDIGVFSLGGSVLYIFKSEKYSARAAFVQTEIQKKSAGSFLLGGYVTYFGAVGDSTFIPFELRDTMNTALSFKQFGVFNYGISFGYSHTFILWKKFYLSFTVVPGFGISRHSIVYKAPIQNREGSVLSARFLARTAFGYNTVRSFGGIVASADSYSGNTGADENSQMNFEVGLFRFFYGRRFNFPHELFKKRKHN